MGYKELGLEILKQAAADFDGAGEGDEVSRQEQEREYNDFLNSRLYKLIVKTACTDSFASGSRPPKKTRYKDNHSALFSLMGVISLDSPTGEDLSLRDSISDQRKSVEDTVVDSVYMQQVSSCLHEAVDCLPALESKVIRCLFFDGLTREETAKELHRTTEQVSQIRRRALQRLRTGRYGKQIRQHYDEIYSCALKGGGVSSFNRTWTSSTEKVALRLAEQSPRFKK